MKTHLVQALRPACFVSAAWLAVMITQAVCKADEPAQPGMFPGEKTTWNVYDRYDFEVDGRSALVVVPKTVASGKPWIWRARFFDDPPGADPALLSRGFHLVIEIAISQ